MNKEKNGLGLLRVCRQIYAETASLPYATGTFKFSYPSYLEHLLQSVQPARREQITTIYVSDSSNVWQNDNFVIRACNAFPAYLLPGLKTVLVDHFFSPHERDYKTSAEAGRNEKVMEDNIHESVNANVEIVFDRKIRV